MLNATFDLQGHRGARGLRPENTLPSFEAALDAGATSVETDLRRTRDGVFVLFHDEVHRAAGRPVRDLTLAELRAHRLDQNPDPARFPDQTPAITPRAATFARDRGIDPHAALTLDDLFAFVAAHPTGRHLRFDLELKREPFRETDDGDRLVTETVEAVRAAGLVGRTTVRSFDHRVVLGVRRREPGLRTAVLVAHTAPVDPAGLACAAGAEVYCPDFEFLDEPQVRQLHAAGVAVLPWTVNDPDDWRRLLDWGVDGITTDYPDRLAILMRERGIAF